MSGTLQPSVVALALAIVVAGCSGTPGDNEVSQAAHAGLNTMRAAGVGHLQAGEARGYIAAHPEALVLDVRESFDELGQIDGARHIPLGELGTRMGEIEAWKGKPIVVVSRDGAGGRNACQILTAAGFLQVSNVEGGMVAYGQAGD